MNDEKEIIDLEATQSGEGEIIYSKTKQPPKPDKFSGLTVKLLGVALGVAVFLFLLFFFVYVVLPLVVILVLWSILRNILRPRRVK